MHRFVIFKNSLQLLKEQSRETASLNGLLINRNSALNNNSGFAKLSYFKNRETQFINPNISTVFTPSKSEDNNYKDDGNTNHQNQEKQQKGESSLNLYNIALAATTLGLIGVCHADNAATEQNCESMKIIRKNIYLWNLVQLLVFC